MATKVSDYIKDAMSIARTNDEIRLKETNGIGKLASCKSWKSRAIYLEFVLDRLLRRAEKEGF